MWDLIEQVIESEEVEQVLGGVDTFGDIDEGITASRNTVNVAEGASKLQKGRHLAGMRPQGPSSLFGPFSLYSGIDALVNGDSFMEQVGGGFEAVAGGIETAGLIGSLVGSESLVAAAAAGGPAAAVTGAAATGIAIGNHGNDSARKRGFLGKNRWGENRNWSDVFGEVAFNPMTAHNAGPALVAAGAGALGTTLYDFGETIGAIPKSPIDMEEVAEAYKQAQAQQAHMDGSSQLSFDAMTKVGMPEQVAEHLASEGNPHFKQQREAARQERKAIDAMVKSGIPEAGARAILGGGE